MQKISLQTTKGSESFYKLDETANFMLLIGSKQTEPQQGRRCYLLYNIRTGVFEAEGLSEAHAHVALKESQELLDKVVSGQIYQQEPEEVEPYTMPPLLN